MSMTTPEFRKHFEEGCLTGRPNLHNGLPLASAALMTHAAFVQPYRQIAIFDAIARAWLDFTDEQERTESLTRDLPFLFAADETASDWQPPRAVWDAFWNIVDAEPETDQLEKPGDVQALDFTARVVAIGQHYDLELLSRCERAVLLHQDVHELMSKPEVRMSTQDLRGWPEDSLGTELLTMLTANGYDLEVINADDVLLPPFFPAQNRTNRRILQLHDVWHLFAGYGFTVQGETCISGFQLAQFGQNYSTRFLAVITAVMCVHTIVDVDQFISLIAEGWRHGRRSPPLMSVPWHKNLGRSIPELRSALGLVPFESRTPQLMNMDAVTLQLMIAQAKAPAATANVDHAA